MISCERGRWSRWRPPRYGRSLGVATDLGDRNGVEPPVQLAVEVVPGGVAAHVVDIANNGGRNDQRAAVRFRLMVDGSVSVDP